MKVLSYDPRKGKVVKVGMLDRGVFVKEVKAKHFMKLTQGYGIQDDAFQQLKEHKCKLVVFKTPTSVLVSQFNDWLAPDIKVLDFGSGKQRFFPVKRMKKHGEKEETKTVEKVSEGTGRVDKQVCENSEGQMHLFEMRKEIQPG